MWFKNLSFVIGLMAAAQGQAAIECNIGEEKSWSSGFMVKDILVTNNSNNAIDNWQVKIVFDGDVTIERSWGAEINIGTNTVTARGVDYNANLNTAESTSFGLKGKGSYSNVYCVTENGSDPTPSSTPNPEATPKTTPDPTPTFSPDPDQPSGSVIYLEDFEALSPGAEWERVDDTQIVQDCPDGQCMRVAYHPTSRGSDRLTKRIPLLSGEHYVLEYDIFFEPGFEFVRGGKLPGLAPDDSVTGCNPSLAQGWSARPMWRANGSAQGYYYGQDRIERCGDGERSQSGEYKIGVWQKVSLEVKLNKRRGDYDGRVILRVDGKVVSRNDNLRIRDEISDRSEITNFYFSTFYGGADSSWAPSKTTYIRYDNFIITDIRIDSVPTPTSIPDPTSLPDPTPTPDIPNDGGSVVRYDSMDNFPSGFHDKRSWRNLWSPAKWANGADEGRIYVDEQEHVGIQGKSVRVLYPKDKRTSSDSGAQWHIDTKGEHEDLYLAYWVKFDDDFDFVLGGKLPGLSGSVSYEDRTHEWKGRLMWREDGKVEFYMHFAEDRERWWWNTEGTQAVFTPGKWHHVEMRFHLNSPGNYDGIMEGWLDGKKYAHYDEVKFRDANEATSMITKVFFSTFFGGSSGDRWNARKDEFAWFDEFTVSHQRIGYPGPSH